MSEYLELRKRLESKPYLMTDVLSGDVRLISEGEALRLMMDSDPIQQTRATTNARSGLEGFANLVGKDDRPFSLKEVAEVAGMSYHLAYNYVQRGIFTPSVRPFDGSGLQGEKEGRFSWRDCYVAGIVGSFRRLGVKPDLLAKIPPLFSETKRKRTRKAAATTSRS